jgi:hypothetical protein
MVNRKQKTTQEYYLETTSITRKKVGSHTLKCLTLLLQVFYLYSKWQSVASMITYRAYDDCKVNMFCSGDKV